MTEINDGSFDYAVKKLDSGVVSRLGEIPLLTPYTYDMGKGTVEVHLAQATVGNERLSYRREQFNGIVSHSLKRTPLDQAEHERTVLIINNGLSDCSGFKFGLGQVEAHEAVINFVGDISAALKQEMQPGTSYRLEDAGISMGGFFPNPEPARMSISEGQGPKYL